MKRAHIVAFALTFSLASNVLPQQTLAANVGNGNTSIQLRDGRRAVVTQNGFAVVFAKDHRSAELHHLKLVPKESEDGLTAMDLPARESMMEQLAKPESQLPYAKGSVVVIFRNGSMPRRDTFDVNLQDVVAMRSQESSSVPKSFPQYTNDYTVNRVFASLGVDKIQRLFRGVPINAQPYGIDPSAAYRLHVSGADVEKAVRALEKIPTIAYVSPDWIVSPMHSEPHALPPLPPTLQVDQFATESTHTSASFVPRNFASRSSFQSLLNAPSDDVLAAYDEIQRHFRQLPGQGEIITNVSVGDVDDASNTHDHCYAQVSATGPTTVLIGKQHYLDLPSMPLIPAYTADIDGTLSGSNEVCQVDPTIDEIGLDFSMMAPLPHYLQRSDALGRGVTDLLGIAPGAQYRLVVPEDVNTTITDIDAALLAAATQRPRPSVITASLGFGFDTMGFPSRYLEEDPLTESIVSTIVHQYGIVVCIAAGDGLRTFTNAAVGPSGGSAATSIATPMQAPTNLDDDQLSTIPSLVYDSGAIDVGGTTLDDIFAAPPYDPAFATLTSQHAFAETRWDGSTLFSSGYGGRVDVSAPSDNVISLEHAIPGTAEQVLVVNNGGTSASAPEVAAAAATALQVARLTGHPFSSPLELRTFLEKTGTPVPSVSQADAAIPVGPQVNLRRIVERLLQEKGEEDRPSVSGIAVEQRRAINNLYLNTLFTSYTDPSNIDLQYEEGFATAQTNADTTAWITIAPNWEFLPTNTSYRLIVAGRRGSLLARTPWARLLPENILHAAGLPLASSQKRSVALRYEALSGMRVIVTADVNLTFGPSGSKVFFGFAPPPRVPSVVTGSKLPVTYDLTTLSGLAPYVSMNRAEIVVSEVGRGDPEHTFYGDQGFAYRVPVSVGSKGTIDVPVSGLEGGGIYGVRLVFNRAPGEGGFPSTIAYTRVQTNDESVSRPAAPLLSTGLTAGGHYLEIPYGGSFDVSYDVSNVSNADGTMLEISAAGPVWDAGEPNFLYNTFNNPNGSVHDHNGIESGSVYYALAGGRRGHIRVNGKALLYPSLNHVVRVIPTRGGIVVGEASEVSTISMDGVAPYYRGGVGINYGIDATDRGAFLTEDSSLADGSTISALEPFDQVTNASKKPISLADDGKFYTTGWGVWPRNIGLVGSVTSGAYGLEVASYSLLNTATGAIASSWSPPFTNDTTLRINEASANQTNDLGAFLVGAGAPYSVFEGDLKHGTFGSLYDIGPVQNFASPAFYGIALNPSTNVAVLAGFDQAAVTCGVTSPAIVTINMGTGAIGTFAGLASNSLPSGVALIDSQNIAVVPSTACQDMALYNLTSHTARDIALPKAGGTMGAYWPLVNAKSKDIMVFQPVSADSDTNINSLSSVLIYSPSGTLLKSIERFTTSFPIVLTANGIQINTTTHSGYVPAYSGQLTPFSY